MEGIVSPDSNTEILPGFPAIKLKTTTPTLVGISRLLCKFWTWLPPQLNETNTPKVRTDFKHLYTIYVRYMYKWLCITFQTILQTSYFLSFLELWALTFIQFFLTRFSLENVAPVKTQFTHSCGLQQGGHEVGWQHDHGWHKQRSKSLG